MMLNHNEYKSINNNLLAISWTERKEIIFIWAQLAGFVAVTYSRTKEYNTHQFVLLRMRASYSLRKNKINRNEAKTHNSYFPTHYIHGSKKGDEEMGQYVCIVYSNRVCVCFS